MVAGRQAISRFRARGPRRVVPPPAAPPASPPAASDDRSVTGGGASWNHWLTDDVDAASGESTVIEGSSRTRPGSGPSTTGSSTSRPSTSAERSGETASGEAATSDGHRARPARLWRGGLRHAAPPASGGSGGEPVEDAAEGPERVRGFTRSGRLRLMWFDRGPGYRIWAGGPVPRGASAWTLDRLVIVRRRRAHDRVLMAHEEEHVRQWDERGRAGFLAWYLWHYFRWRLRGYNHLAAYRRIPAEIEAEWRSRRRLGIGCSTTDSGSKPTDR